MISYHYRPIKAKMQITSKTPILKVSKNEEKNLVHLLCLRAFVAKKENKLASFIIKHFKQLITFI